MTFATFVVETDDTPAVPAIKHSILGQVGAAGFGQLPHNDLDNRIIWQNRFRTFDSDHGELVCRVFMLEIFYYNTTSIYIYCGFILICWNYVLLMGLSE